MVSPLCWLSSEPAETLMRSLVFLGLLTGASRTAVRHQLCLWLVLCPWLTEAWTYPVTLWMLRGRFSLTRRTTKRCWTPKTTLKRLNESCRVLSDVLQNVGSFECLSVLVRLFCCRTTSAAALIFHEKALFVESNHRARSHLWNIEVSDCLTSFMFV